jgi:uncharacterized protein (TIGR02145 family)
MKTKTNDFSFLLNRINETQSNLGKLTSNIKELSNALRRIAEGIEAPEQPFVTINGLKWNRENLSIDGKEHFTHEEALTAAASVGKRLPTPDEWEALLAPGSTWDEEKNGHWFGADHELKSDSKESIFLPAAGYRSLSNGSLNYRGYNGYYWSARRYSGTNAYYIYFSSSSGTGMNDTYRSHGLSVRLVSDL